jgi:hypothetical protein
MSGRTKKPLPRAVPVSIEATAGSAALTTSSIEPGPAEGAAPVVAAAGCVSVTLPVTGATNTSDAGAAVAEAAATLGVAGAVSGAAAGCWVCDWTMNTALAMPTAEQRITSSDAGGPLRSISGAGEADDAGGDAGLANPHRHASTRGGTRRAQEGQVQET